MIFSWDDGEQAVYETDEWLPNVDAPQERRQQVVETLDLGSVLVTQRRAGSEDRRAPRTYRLEWEPCDPTLIPIIEETWTENRAVDVSVWYRGAQVELVGYYVTEYEERELAGGLYGLRLALQEVRV